MTDRTKRDELAADLERQASDPKWVIEMQEHFQRQGFYRAEDLERVLGDPRQRVRGSKTADFEPANLLGLSLRFG